MRIAFLILLISFLCGDAGAQTRPASRAAPLGIDELRERYAREQYSQVIQGAARLAGSKALGGEERHEALRLKAESHLRLGDLDLASKSFDDASAAATEATAAATDRATAMLVRRSKRGVYTPQAGSATEGTAQEPFSVLEPDARKLALKALYRDERSDVDTAMSRLSAQSDLPAMLEALDAAASLRMLETAALGGGEQTDELLAPLSQRAQDLLKERIETVSDRVAKLDKAANKKKKMGSAYRKRGLAAEEMKQLRDDVQTCRDLAFAAGRFAAVAIADAPKHEALKLEAHELGNKAEGVLLADYGGIYDRD